ncbi:MAG: hypothetical protein ACHQSE_14950 [Gemmatimonadales bacterium]
MTPLLRLELRRQRPMVVKMAVLTAIVCGVFFAAGKRAPSDLLAVMMGSGLGAVLIVPMGISRDKMEGTLDFLCGLPVDPRAIAASLALPATAHVNPVVVVVLTWLAMLLIGACTVAALTCFELESLLGAPLVGLVIAFVLVPRAVRALVPAVTGEAVVRFLQQPAAPLLVAACLLAMGTLVGAMAFGMTTRGFANYRTDPARR